MHKIWNKRILCLLLCMVMLLGVMMTSCGEQTTEEKAEEIQEEASEEARTLAMYLMSEKAVSETTRKNVENAINRITKAKFTAQIKLYIYPEAEYYTKLEAAFAARDEAKESGLLGNTAGAEETDLSSETSEEGGSAVEIVYPEIADYQVDIFYMGGADRYQKYIAEDRLKNISNRLAESGSAGEIRKYVYQPFFTALEKTNGGRMFAVPTNKRIGEYTYLLLNKEAMIAAERLEPGQSLPTANPSKDVYNSVAAEDVADLLSFIKQYYSDEFSLLYTNVAENELMIDNLKFWGVDSAGKLSDAFSVLGNYYNGAATLGQSGVYGSKIENLFENTAFVNTLRTLHNYKTGGYYAAKNDTKDFAVGYVKGGAEVADQYADKYEVIVLETPTLSYEEAHSDLFGVCSYTADESRAMDILAYLNTNETFRNLVMYGVEGTHYNVRQVGVDGETASDDDDEVYKVVERLLIGSVDEYKMSIHKTGNELLVYPEMGTA
ncbi:MAG: hypothetical protein IKA76_05125, partial [Clostridia bacterium]|nr:hypothetical protein [Clostridia bacterium]